VIEASAHGIFGCFVGYECRMVEGYQFQFVRGCAMMRTFDFISKDESAIFGRDGGWTGGSRIE
jgi:hypothetical protein